MCPVEVFLLFEFILFLLLALLRLFAVIYLLLALHAPHHLPAFVFLPVNSSSHSSSFFLIALLFLLLLLALQLNVQAATFSVRVCKCCLF